MLLFVPHYDDHLNSRDLCAFPGCGTKEREDKASGGG
jgi:hypothetical protein